MKSPKSQNYFITDIATFWDLAIYHEHAGGWIELKMAVLRYKFHIRIGFYMLGRFHRFKHAARFGQASVFFHNITKLGDNQALDTYL